MATMSMGIIDGSQKENNSTLALESVNPVGRVEIH